MNISLLKTQLSAIQEIKQKISQISCTVEITTMSSRFNFFWKQFIPSHLNRSDLEVPFGKANYRSLFSDPLNEATANMHNLEDSSCRGHHNRQKYDPLSIEDVVG